MCKLSIGQFWICRKKCFYGYLKSHQIDTAHFGDYFNDIHQALQTFYGINHYKIERTIIQILNDRARHGIYQRTDEIAAFGCMVNTFMAETERNLEQNKSRARMAKYAEMLETQVKEANMKLESAERLAAIGETAAMVGHDIRNPLQSIVGELYLQKQDIASLPEGATKKSLLESIQSIEENVFYINKIVSDLQDFAKPIKVENQEEAAVDLNTILLDTLSIVPFSDLVQVEVFIDSDFPALAINQQVLKRALTNLITNALQAMPDGGRLTIRGVCAEDKAEISVEDTGTGIPDEVKSRMFQPLFTTKAKGQGLGLAVVKRLIEAQNGTVTFESQEGHGTKFILQLPTKKTSPAQ